MPGRMNKEELIELTNRLYKITLLFPKKEPLRYKTREKADQILENFIALGVFHSPDFIKTIPVDKLKQEDLFFELEKDFEILKTYFEIAKWQNWVNYFDILEIQEKYDKIKSDFKKQIQSPEQEKSLKIEFPKSDRKQPSIDSLDPRKEKILDVLKEKGQVQVWEVKEIFPDITKRTLRRDFEKLLKQGLIERIGEKNSTYYQLKNQEV